MFASETRHTDGSVGLYIDGKKTPPLFFGLSDIPGSATNTYYAWKNIRNFAAQGIHLVSIDTELRDCWFKQSPYEWEAMQEEIAAAQIADPDCGVLIRLHLNPPYWWMRDHPEETVLYEGVPGIDDGESFRLIRDDHNRHLRVSLASERWLAEAGERLRQFCENVWDSPEGRAVVGIQVACGKNGEWHQWGCDTSAPMERRFRRLLREKYGTDEALRRAWNDPDVTIEAAPFCPSDSQPRDDGTFRDPAKSMRILDAQTCIQITVPEAILHFCRIIKESWGRPVLTGAFYGYYYGTSGAIGGHLMPEMLYAHPELIDFLCGPCPYGDNRKPEYIPMQRGLLESNRLRGMLWLTENDQRPAGVADFPGGDPSRINETIAMLRRTVLMPLTAGQGLWFYDHREVIRDPSIKPRDPYCSSIFRKTGWWDNEASLAEIGMLRRIAEEYCLRPYKGAADVLIVNQPAGSFLRPRAFKDEMALQTALSKNGVAYDCIYLNELEKAEMERYRLIIFADTWLLDAAAREMIRTRTKGKQVVWLYAPGYTNGGALSEAHIADITGISVKRIAPESLGADEKPLNPCFAVADAEAEPLAFYGSGSCAAARKGDQWYYASLSVTPEQASQFIDAAGAHRYTDSGEPVLAGAGLVAMHTCTGGERTVTLRNGKVLQLTLAPQTTVILDAETGRRVDMD